MYVAQRELKYIPLGTDKVIIYKAGDVIPDFEDWHIHAKRAHLNLEWVAKVEGEEKLTKLSSKMSSKKPGILKKAVKASETKLMAVKCGTCEREFKTAKAAKTHATLAHK